MKKVIIADSQNQLQNQEGIKREKTPKILNKKAQFVQKNIIEDRKFYNNIKNISRQSKVNIGTKLENDNLPVDEKTIMDVQKAGQEKDEWVKYLKLQEVYRQQQDNNELQKKKQYEKIINSNMANMIEQKQKDKQNQIQDSKQQQMGFKQLYQQQLEQEQEVQKMKEIQKKQFLQQQINDLKKRSRSNKLLKKQKYLEEQEQLKQHSEFLYNEKDKISKHQRYDILQNNIKENQKSYQLKLAQEPTLEEDKKISQIYFDQNSEKLQRELNTQKEIIKLFQTNSVRNRDMALGPQMIIEDKGNAKKQYYDNRNEKGLLRKHKLEDNQTLCKQQKSVEFYQQQKQQLNCLQEEKQKQQLAKQQEVQLQRGRLQAVIEEVKEEQKTKRQMELEKQRKYMQELNQQMQEKTQRNSAKKNRMDKQEYLLNMGIMENMASHTTRNNLY